MPFEAFCNTFRFIKLPFFIKIFVLSIFERLFYTGFTANLRTFSEMKKDIISLDAHNLGV